MHSAIVKSHNKEQKGQLLIEILISLAILILVISGIMAAVTVSVRNSAFARNKSLANQYAQECLEKIRQKRDNQGLSSISSSDCPSLSFPFTRTVTISGTTEKIVTAVVSWREGSKTYNTTLKTILTNWK